MAILLALDVGEVRVGTATADSTTGIAFSGETFLRAEGEAEREILRIITEKEVKTMVVGLPLGPDGTKNKQCSNIENFCRRIKRRIKVEIVYSDEYLSSQEADEILGTRKGSRKTGKRDAVAAALILQGYLDSLKAKVAK